MEADMRAQRGTYAGYSIGVGISWAVRLVLVWRFAPADKRKSNILVFLGFVIGWTSATIARQVYPPPRKHQQEAGKTA
jgi:hypothetical protein